MKIDESRLSNSWKIRDLCQGVCCELDNVVCCQNLDIQDGDRDGLKKDYDAAKDLIDRLTAGGFFSKDASMLSSKETVDLVNDILSYEEKNSTLIASVWENEITKPEDFTQKDFNLCVKPLSCAFSDIEQTLKKEIEKEQNFVVTHLISNSNIVLKNQTIAVDTNSKDQLPFGLVYSVSKESFIAATDEESSVSIRKEYTDKDFMYTDKRGDEYLFLTGFGTKLRIPKQIIAKNSGKRFTQNNNAVVLDGRFTKPVAIFCYDHGIAKINKLRARLNFIAKKWNLPLITINMASFYKRNGVFFTSNTMARTVFNSYVDYIVSDLNELGQTDIWREAKKLIGLNTNLRYNFVYKFSQMLTSHVKEKGLSMDEVGGFIEKAFVKSVAKHNTLTRAREISSGAPLIFPSEDSFIALPNEFIKTE